MNKILVNRYDCEQCLLIAPFTYAACLHKIIYDEDETICETTPEMFLNTTPGKNFKLGKGIKLRDGIRSILEELDDVTLDELCEFIPEYTKASIRVVLSNMYDVKSTKVPLKRWSTYSLEKE